MFLSDDNNTIINAECGFDLDGTDFCIVVESSGGANPKRGIARRNPDYNKLMTTLLSRLQQCGARVKRIVLESEKVAHLPVAARVAPLPYTYPIDLVGLDIETFRKTLGRTIAGMHREPGVESSGNSQKKIRIVIDRIIPAEQLVTAAPATAASETDDDPDGPPEMTETERKELKAARKGQGKFRSALLKRYGGRCAAAGIANEDLLVASHIKPWKVSTNAERLDPDNGILLSALIDRLFDSGLITFSDTGTVIASPLLSPADHAICRLSDLAAIPLPAGSLKYLAYHRTIKFRKREDN